MTIKEKTPEQRAQIVVQARKDIERLKRRLALIEACLNTYLLPNVPREKLGDLASLLDKRRMTNKTIRKLESLIRRAATMEAKP